VKKRTGDDLSLKRIPVSRCLPAIDPAWPSGPERRIAAWCPRYLSSAYSHIYIFTSAAGDAGWLQL